MFKEYMFTLYYKDKEIVVEVNTHFIKMYDSETGKLYFDSRDNYCSIPELRKVYEDVMMLTANGVTVLSATLDSTIVYNCEVIE